MNRRGDKVVEVEGYLRELESILPKNIDEYLGSLEKKAACERYFEKIVESCVDLAFLIIKENGFRSAESSKESFEILSENGIISGDLALQLGNAKSMRNWLAHQYGEVDDKRVFDVIHGKLIFDVRTFLEAIR
jgi:uncharacterized protein YutE (UPF0331/DUF86 family)